VIRPAGDSSSANRKQGPVGSAASVGAHARCSLANAMRRLRGQPWGVVVEEEASHEIAA
jgi:hypothetical protein